MLFMFSVSVISVHKAAKQQFETAVFLLAKEKL